LRRGTPFEEIYALRGKERPLMRVTPFEERMPLEERHALRGEVHLRGEDAVAGMASPWRRSKPFEKRHALRGPARASRTGTRCEEGHALRREAHHLRRGMFEERQAVRNKTRPSGREKTFLYISDKKDSR
jgi:hypothetical protein